MIAKKKLLAAILILWGAPLAVMLGVWTWASRAGTIVVHVDEHRPGGDRVHIQVPGALAEVALQFLPDVMCVEAADHYDEWAPIVEAACSELSSCPDGVFVEASGPREHVRIMKKGRSIVVNVDSDDETVHIVMPLRIVSTVLSKFDGAGRGIRGCIGSWS